MSTKVEKVLVACGGDSPERDVSLRSGAAVCQALAEDGWPSELLTLQTPKDILPLLREGTAVFVALHGGWGEDGRFQALLEMAGIPYTGSGPEGCRYAMDKVVSKLLFRQYDIPTAAFSLLHSGEECSGEILCALSRRVAEGEILVVKPSSAGSTVGVSIVRKEEELAEAVREAARFGETVLVEDYIPGKELTVTVWDDGRGPLALPIVEIRPKGAFYTYEAKYTPFSSEYLVPAPLDETTSERVRRVAVEAHRATRCEIYSRVDLRLDPRGNPWVLEVNAVPGMTATSLVPKAAAAFGWSFSELTGQILRASLRKRG
jgi:D-alanine-D-alanine ligase